MVLVLVLVFLLVLVLLLALVLVLVFLRVGDTVVVNGWGIGTDHWGGYAGEASIR